MFWTYRLRETIKERFAHEIEKKIPLVIRDEKTMSGRVHVGSLRGVVIHGIVSEVLIAENISNRYLFEVNDFDPMDGLPVYVDQERYRPYMGRLLCDVPAPAGSSAANYAEHWAAEFREDTERLGFKPEYYRSSELYRAGKYNDCIRQALDAASRIREIYREISGSVKDETWYPLQVVCQSCGKVGTTKVVAWNGSLVRYRCLPSLVSWAAGCGNEGTVAPWDGAAKLPWKVEWAAKFKVIGVHIEGGGKDHYTKGGSRDIARAIVREVFGYPDPIDIPYDFFVVGGKKMSSSKGLGSFAREITDLLPPHMVRLLMMKEPKRPIDFEPSGDTIPILYDHYDEIATSWTAGGEDDWASIFPFIRLPHERKQELAHYRPRFSQVAYLVQMPHIDFLSKLAIANGKPLTEREVEEARERARYATRWLASYSPEKYKFEIQETLPSAVENFSQAQRIILGKIRERLVSEPDITGEALHGYIHELKQESGITPADVFSAIYLCLLGKTSGPQAGWFLTALDRTFVLQRLVEASS